MLREVARRASAIWSNQSLRVKGLAVVAIPLLALLVTSGSWFFVERQHREAERWVMHTFEVRTEIQEMRALLVDAETGVRGYLLTGEEDFLSPYQTAGAALPQRLLRLEALVEDNPAQRARLGQIRPLVDQRLGQLATLRDSRGLGNVTAREQAALLREGKILSDTLRQELDTMQREEERLLAERVARAERAEALAMQALGISVPVGLLLGLLATALFTRGIVHRIKRLEENAARFTQGLSLLPWPGGDDEIGRLGWQLGRSKALLVERESALREAQAFLEQLIATNPGVIFRATLPDHGVTYVSPTVERLTGYAPADVLRDSDFWLARVHSEDRERLTDACERLRAGTAAQEEVEYRFQRLDGDYRWFYAILRPERDDARGESVVGNALDITERKQVEEDLQRATAEARQANQAKSEFLSRMSHELRTPLNAILGFAQLLDLDDLADEQRESVSYILKAGRHLLAMINDVLDIARIESGHLRLSPEPLRVSDLLQEVVDLIRPFATQRQVLLDDDEIGQCTAYVLADQQRLKQILLNLLSNSVKYNREEGTVSVFCVDAAPDRLRIVVRDNGIGIAPDKLDRLFSAFDRLGAEQTAIEGSGLGLALSRRLVEAMGGTIGVQSEVGVGSRFWIDLPRVARPEEQVGQSEARTTLGVPATSAPRTVLYIEDNLATHRLLERVFAQFPGVRLLPAMQGQLGLELAREHRPDLILLDMNLPDMSGEEVLARLQADQQTRQIPVLMVSADATEGQIRRLRAAGAREYLTKPLDLQQFYAIVSEILT